MELRQFTALIWRRLWLIVLSIVVVGGLTYLFSVMTTPVFETSTTLEINFATDPRDDPSSSLAVSERAAKGYVQQIRSIPVAREVVGGLGVSIAPEKLLEMFSAEQIRDTQLIRIRAESTNPELAKAVANKVVDVFIAQTEARQGARYQASKRDLDAQIAELEKQISDTHKALAALGDPGDARNATMPEFARLERSKSESNLTNYQTRYAILLRSVEDFRLAAARAADKLSVFAAAETPRSPVRPRTQLNLLLGLIGGLVLGASITLLLEYLDDTVKDPEAITSGLGLTLLGAVARAKGLKRPGDALVAASASGSPGAEAYRVLRSNFQFTGINNPHASVVVTSAGPGEGKTTTLANLGIALAQAGKRVILVDTDLRRPTLHRLFGVSRERGLTDLILNPETDPDQFLTPVSVEGLRLLPSGALPPNPAEILSSRRMTQIIAKLKEGADVVLFDSPPVLSVADAAILAAGVGNAILVVAAGETRTGAASQARDELVRTNTRVLGVALNKVNPGRGGHYYYYYRRYYGGDGTRVKKRKESRQGGDA